MNTKTGQRVSEKESRKRSKEVPSAKGHACMRARVLVSFFFMEKKVCRVCSLSLPDYALNR